MKLCMYDGILTVMYDIENPKVDRICIDGQYDEPFTLEQIAKKSPTVYMIIFEEPLKGKIFRYGNHEPNVWEEVGTTKGYA